MERTDQQISVKLDLVVGKLDSVLGQLNVMQDQLDFQSACLRHADSLRPLGTPFSGMALCGAVVELTIHTPFDYNGVFNHPNDFVIVVLPGLRMDFEEPDIMWMDTKPWKWDSAVREGWGSLQYDEVRSKMAKWYGDQNHELTVLDATCVDMGVKSVHEWMFSEVHATALRIRNPGVLGFEPRGIVLTCCDLQRVYIRAHDIMHDIGVPPAEKLEVFCIATNLAPLALTCLGHSASSPHGAGKLAWAALTPCQRVKLATGEHPFFTRERLALVL